MDHKNANKVLAAAGNPRWSIRLTRQNKAVGGVPDLTPSLLAEWVLWKQRPANRSKFHAYRDRFSSLSQDLGYQEFVDAKAPIRRLNDVLRCTKLVFWIGVHASVRSSEVPNSCQFPPRPGLVGNINFRSLIRERVVKLAPEQNTQIIAPKRSRNSEIPCVVRPRSVSAG